ncbi:hypothetical protein PybrP1_000238 [[Pythium] brassicae (nom. inval.)]|nr:hypothetical protein PybrP1_000238 [[Pythium] brassicae (nom. inval.)]
MWTLFTEEQIDAAASQLFMPLTLLINYTLLLYLLYFYWSRRHEPRMVLLFGAGAVGVACLVPFANPDSDVAHGMNDASESCCVLTFLVQITIVGSDLNARFKIKSVLYLTYVAEALICANLAMIALSFVATFAPGSMSGAVKEQVPNAFESGTLLFIFGFRFYYIAMARGWRSIVRTRKLELFWYVLFTTHELPFEILTWASGLPWEFVQALYMRVTIAGCLILTANAKIRNSSKYATSKVSVGADNGCVDVRKRVSVTCRLSQTSTGGTQQAAEPRIIE